MHFEFSDRHPVIPDKKKEHKNALKPGLGLRAY